MNKQSTDFTKLWQEQPVSTIDLADLERRLRRQRRLQRFYIAFDLMGLIPAVLVLIYAWESLSRLESSLVLGLIVFVFGFYLYITWLRRHAALASFEETNCYVEILKKQLLNNQKIARLTFHSCWVSLLVMIIFFGAMGLFEELSLEKLIDSIPVLLIVAVGLGVMARWAILRERKFKQEYARLIQQEEG